VEWNTWYDFRKEEDVGGTIRCAATLSEPVAKRRDQSDRAQAATTTATVSSQLRHFASGENKAIESGTEKRLKTR
jgi:hypothetical protein